MKNEEAYAALMKRDPQWLSRPIEELVKIVAVGEVYVTSHQALLKKLKKGDIKLAEEDYQTRLKEGQTIGEAVLDAQVRIGQLLPTPKEALANTQNKRGLPLGNPRNPIMPEGFGKADPSGAKKAMAARALAANPAAVAAIKAEAKRNEDIPTKTAVLNRIKYEKEKAYNEKAKAKKESIDNDNGLIASLEEQQYLNALERVIMILPQAPPKNWNEKALKIASGYVAIINKRLEAFNGQTIKGNTIRSIGSN